jgi:hypothetical protein
MEPADDVPREPIPPAPEALPPLRRRPPRAWWVHWLIDTAVVFVGVAFLALLTGLSLIAVAVVAAALGAVAAPLTRRAEIRALAERAP